MIEKIIVQVLNLHNQLESEEKEKLYQNKTSYHY